MASGFNTTSFAKGLKVRYAPNVVETMVLKDKPALALLRKMEKFTGERLDVPVNFDDPASRSAVFSTAQTLAATSSTQLGKFQITRIKDYGVVTIDNETLEASADDQGAFWKARTHAIDGIMRSTAESAEISLYRGGWGTIGNISTTAGSVGATTTLTLANRTDCLNFKKGMGVQFAAAEGTGTLRAATVLTVVSVNRQSGTLTMSANLNTVAGIAQGDFIFAQGDREDAASPTRRKMAGFNDWLPTSDPSATLFFGQDRTVDSRLYGCRVDGSTMQLEEALVQICTEVHLQGGKVDTVLLNSLQYGNLVNSLGSRVSYVDVSANTKASIGFRGIELFTMNGTVNVVPSRFCPVTDAYALQLDTWEIGSLRGIPRILNQDSLDALRQPNDDGIEIRVGYYGNVYCKAPGWNGRVFNLPVT